MLLMFFYKKEELKGKQLHELDQAILHAIAGWFVIHGCNTLYNFIYAYMYTAVDPKSSFLSPFMHCANNKSMCKSMIYTELHVAI